MPAVMDEGDRQLNDPTPDWIKDACREIREEHLRKKAQQEHGWEPQSGRPAIRGPSQKPAKRLPQ